MKKLFLTILASLLLLSCQQDVSQTNPVNVFNPENRIDYQIFDLTKVSDSIIIGKESTKIYFDRNHYKIQKNDSVTLRLVEFYSFEELLYNNIATITDNNELLESSGVIYFDVLANGKPAKLKTGNNIKVEFPAGRLRGNEIFNARVDSLGRFEWIQTDSTNVEMSMPDIAKNDEFGLDDGYYYDRIIPVDSLEYYRNLQEEFTEKAEMRDIAYNEVWPVLLDNYGWINIDKFVNVNSYSDYTVNIKNIESTWISSYVLYKGLNSILAYIHYDNEVKLDSIPTVGDMSVVLIGQKGKKLFYNKIELRPDLKEYEGEFVETTIEDLKEIIKQ